MAEDRLQVTSSHLLIVEGKDEVGFFQAYLRHHAITNIQIMSIGGKTQLRARLNAVVNLSNFSTVKAVGVVRDSDGKSKGAFDSVRSALQSVDLPSPRRSREFTSNTPYTGILIMPPGNEGTGRMLEDVCVAAVSDDPAFSCVSIVSQKRKSRMVRKTLLRHESTRFWLPVRNRIYDSVRRHKRDTSISIIPFSSQSKTL